MTVPTFFSASMKLYVKINGILTPFRKSVDSMQRFCRPLRFHNDDSDYDLSVSGSCFLFCYNARNYIICTNHQLISQGRSPHEIVMVVKDDHCRNVAITPNQATRISVSDAQQKAAEDILFLEYDSCRRDHVLSQLFFDLDIINMATLPGVKAESTLMIFSIGYPTRFSSFEFSMEGDDAGGVSVEVVSRWAKLYLERCEPSAWDPPMRLPLIAHPAFHSELGDPDGFSGSPVFFIYLDHLSQAKIGFVGIITHANALGRFAIYDATHIRQLVSELSNMST